MKFFIDPGTNGKDLYRKDRDFFLRTLFFLPVQFIEIFPENQEKAFRQFLAELPGQV